MPTGPLLYDDSFRKTWQVLSVVLMAPLLILVGQLVSVTAILGHIPSYGFDPDPSTLGIAWLGLPFLLLLIAMVPVIPAWLSLSVLLRKQLLVCCRNWLYLTLAAVLVLAEVVRSQYDFFIYLMD